MADNKFKTAAAKLLAQHAAKQENRQLATPDPVEDAAPAPVRPTQETLPATEASAPVRDTAPIPAKPPRNLNLVWQTEPSAAAPFTPPPLVPAPEPAVPASSFSLYKISMVLLHAVIGCGLMFELIPPIAGIGIAGNIAIGLVGGAALGLIVTKIL